MKAVGNSTPLIYLARLNKLPLLEQIFKEIFIPEEVHREVVLKGKELNKPEVIAVENAIQNGAIKIKEIKSNLDIETLHKGELDAISLALGLNIENILMDDKEGIEVCRILGLKAFRTTTLLLEFLKLDLINLKEFKDLLIELSKSGYFMRAEIFDFLVREAEKIKVSDGKG